LKCKYNECVQLSSAHSIQLTLYQVQIANTTVTPTQDRLAESPLPKKKNSIGVWDRRGTGTHWGEEKCVWAYGG